MINTGDAAFILVCAAMVCFMTPALAIFYAGLLRKNNVIDIMTQSFIAIGVVTPLWMLCGFSLAFAPSVGGVIGNLQYAFLNGVGAEPNAGYAETIPFILFFGFQIMFAIITPALVSGTIAERTTLKSYVLFLIFWSLLVYVPICHWVWGGGFLASLGLADFAGGTVVHMSAGFSALAAVFVLGNRKKQDYTPHNMVYVAVGVAILWFGWLAFNGGSALGANATAAYALTNSQISAAVGLVTWMALTYRTEKRPTCLGAMMGGLAGLVSVTPGAGYVAPWAAAAMGLIGTACCYFAIQFRIKKNMDDTLDVWGLHGIGGLTGLLLTGVFACPDICAYTGAIYGNPGQIVTQLIGCAVTAVFAFGMTFLIFKGIGALTPLRVSAEVEAKGIDEAVYREKGAVE